MNRVGPIIIDADCDRAWLAGPMTNLNGRSADFNAAGARFGVASKGLGQSLSNLQLGHDEIAFGLLLPALGIPQHFHQSLNVLFHIVK